MAPRFLNTPHYFPQLLEDTKDQKKALAYCLKKCEGGCRQIETCKMTCNVDYNAVENFSVKKKKVRFADLCNTNGLNSSIPVLASNCLQNNERNRDPELVPARGTRWERARGEHARRDFRRRRDSQLSVHPRSAVRSGQAGAYSSGTNKETFALGRSQTSRRNVTTTNSPGPTFGDEASAHPAAFWIPFVVVGIFLSLVLLVFGITLVSKKIGQ